MKRITTTAFAAAALAAALITGTQAASAPEGGQAIFDANCAQCHNATSAEARVGPGLKGLFKAKTLPATKRPVTDANVTSQIRDGGGGMPAFGEKLGAEQIGSLVAYLKTL